MRLKRFVITVCLFLNLFAGYALASEVDAIMISQNIRARHMPFSIGIVVDPVFDSPAGEEIVGYTHCGDAAIWTGHYLAAEAFRYNVTRSDEAIDNVRAAVAGIASLLNVTGTNLLGRCLVPMDSQYAQQIIEEEAPKWRLSEHASRVLLDGQHFTRPVLGCVLRSGCGL